MQLDPGKLRGPDATHALVAEMLGDDVHATRVLSFANGVVGVMHAAALGIHAIGRGLSDALDLDPKHAVKQVDRLLSNQRINVWEWFSRWVPFVVGDRKELLVAIDWTEFTRDGQATLAIYAVTNHGRATPLVWKTIDEDKRSEPQIQLIERLHEILPSNVDVMVLGDRGFGDQNLCAYLDTLGWSYVIRLQDRVKVAVGDETKPAREWVPTTGNVKMIRDVLITLEKTPIQALVVKHQKAMKEPWCLATNRPDLGGAEVVKRYSRRFTIEETFRDIKDNRFGLGLSNTRIGSPARRDRLLFIAAVAQALLTVLGAAGEACGLDRILKTNTSPKRQMSLFNQGSYWYSALPRMREERARPLMEKFGELISTQPAFQQLCGVL
jgi:hypothetical protein